MGIRENEDYKICFWKAKPKCFDQSISNEDNLIFPTSLMSTKTCPLVLLWQGRQLYFRRRMGITTVYFNQGLSANLHPNSRLSEKCDAWKCYSNKVKILELCMVQHWCMSTCVGLFDATINFLHIQINSDEITQECVSLKRSAVQVLKSSTNWLVSNWTQQQLRSLISPDNFKVCGHDYTA